MVIGELVAEAMEKVGGEGVITVEEAKTTETTLDVVEGMQFDRGFVSPYFVTNPDEDRPWSWAEALHSDLTTESSPVLLAVCCRSWIKR